MTDITKCQNDGCPCHDACWRFTAPASDWQAYADFKPGPYGCEHFWPDHGAAPELLDSIRAAGVPLEQALVAIEEGR